MSGGERDERLLGQLTSLNSRLAQANSAKGAMSRWQYIGFWTVGLGRVIVNGGEGGGIAIYYIGGWNNRHNLDEWTTDKRHRG